MLRPLPQPALRRWQPLRIGLTDMFYYDQEEFWFRDGRLLLRGNNGTGKSKVLALTLPFLLDGDLSPHRVEPDADPKKRMEWNLLLGGAHPYPERLGYAWVEFGRLDERGEALFCTLGCGLKAVSGRGIARHWFFVSQGRVGPDLALVDATGTALSRERLIDALGEHGLVYDRAKDYRRAVDERLFGFGEQRYTALVDMLVQLRQPQLSKRPSEKALSAALTEALPPLDQAVLADVAEAFRSLEEDRDELTTMIEARDAATSFLAQYRHYARTAARRRAATPRKAQSSYEAVQSELKSAEAALAAAEADLAAARAGLERLRTERHRLQASDQVLRASPEMRTARELELSATEARRLRAETTRLAGERDRAAEQLRRQRRRHAEATARLAGAVARVQDGRRRTLESATGARIGAEHTERVERLLADQPDLDAPRREAERLAERQRQAIKHVRRLIAAGEAAARALADARSTVARLDGDADELAQRRAGADERLLARGGELVAAVRAHLDGVVELRLADLAATIAELALWVETLDGENPALVAARTQGQLATGELARADARLETRQRAAQARADELTGEIERLERGEDTAPPPPHTRDPASRAGRLGAPLWELIDFVDDVTDADRAGIEAALEAAGVLDAWVTPAGEVLGHGGFADVDDVLLRPGAAAPNGLARVLCAAVDRADPSAASVSDAVIEALLATIALGEHGDCWIGPDGRFRIGPLDGRWHKPVATYIGRGAREAARRARLVTLREELAAVDAERERLGADRCRVGERVATLRAELTGLPGDAALRQAHADLGTLVAEARRLAERRERAAQALATATEADAAARAALAEGSDDADLPAEPGELAEVDGALGEYRVALAGLWPAVEAERDAARQEHDTAEDAERAATALAELAERVQRAELSAVAAEQDHRTRLETVGAAVAELQARLAELTRLLDVNETAQTDAGQRVERAIDARGTANGRRENLLEQLGTATAARNEATASFQRFAGTGLLAVALPELQVPDPAEAWAPFPTVRLARRVNDELCEVADDDNTWDRAQHRLNTELKALQDTLSRHGNRAEAQMLEDGVVIEIEFQNRRASVPQLADALATEVADRERLLSEREREILENHLVNEVASTLQELISQADARVLAMNAELAARPTSTGMQLRLLWPPRRDGPTGLEAARERLLRQRSDAWSDSDRAAVGAFLQSEIARVRAKNAQGTWLEHLTEALDYRSWNEFVIQRYQNGQWRSATGPASGGERVLAASVPLFAAASSHYASAGNPHAPRLVTLDEAFAGVDDNARAKYLGLLAAFDLDVVMTSEREWGCYPEVPGLAISQLSRTDEVAAVLVTNWEWDGTGPRRRVPRPMYSVAAGEPEPTAEPSGLWG
jgi:uncharacterized protein (TIGR02680 family)